QWILSRPNITNSKDLKGKKIATTGVASVSTFMFKNILPKYGLDGNKDVVFTDPGVGNQAVALMSGAVDAAIVSVEQRYAGIDNGMKELMYLGNEVKNSWGTTAASDKFMKEQPKLMAGFMRATLKALRWIRRDRPGTIAAFTRCSTPKRRWRRRGRSILASLSKPTPSSIRSAGNRKQKDEGGRMKDQIK